MATDIRVPTLGESVTEATIGKWFKKPGDAVKADEPLVELETDKVTLEVNAPAAGVLGEIVAKEGETVGVGALLGSITAGAGAAGRSAAAAAPKAAGARRRAAPAAAAPRRRAAARPRPPAGTPTGPAVERIAAESGSIPRRSPARARTAASPRATCSPPSRPRRAAPPPPRRPSQVRAPSPRRRRRRAKSACKHDQAAPDHRAPPEGSPEHRRHADHLQRGRHVAR